MREVKKDKNVKALFEIGTCGLHAMHGAFKHGRNASGWGTDKMLLAIKKYLVSHLQDELTMKKYLTVISFYYNFVITGGLKTRLFFKEGFKCSGIW